ncbi:MAG: DEAD/DEAH box helicase family protein [Solirubrobacteraceae bacterium]
MTAWREDSVRPRARRLVAPSPGARDVELRLAGRVEVGWAGLPASLRDSLRRTAAFANPEFFERERSRLSTHKTPRVIACHEEIADQLLLPRGCRAQVEEEIAAAGLGVRLRDDRADGDAISLVFTGTLTPPQQAAVDALAPHEIGVLVAPPGAGKTVMGAALIARRARSTLVLVHRRPLLEQWIARLTRFLGIEPGTIGPAGQPTSASGVDVAMIQFSRLFAAIASTCPGTAT